MGRWGHHVEPVKAPVCRKSSESDVKSVELKCRYIWKDIEKTAVFPADSSEDISGALPSAPFGPLKDYEDKLKAIELCSRGLGKLEVAQALGKSEHWVKRWWRQDPHLIPKPTVAHGALVQNAPLLSFRDLDLRRDFLSDQDCGETLLKEAWKTLKWEPARRATRDPDTGDLRVRFDHTGNSITQPGRFVAEYKGGMASLDKVLQRMVDAANIKDPRARVFLNYYEDGKATCPVHRHDFWTCTLSLGASRIALIEGRPILLRGGDLLVFGTQAHGCPNMPDVGSTRASIVVFYYPDATSIERRWATCEDDDEQEDEDSPASQVDRTAAPKLVDADLLGCPGISLGLASRRAFRTEHPVTIFSVGCGLLTQQSFFSEISRFQVVELWDLRHGLSKCAQHFAPESLKIACNSRFVKYHRCPLGRPEAGGIRAHLMTDEGLDVLARIVSSAQEKQVAFLGQAEDWRECDRQVVAADLASGKLGPVSVIHIGVGVTETHPAGHALPPWLGPAPRQHKKSDAGGYKLSSGSDITTATVELATPPVKCSTAPMEAPVIPASESEKRWNRFMRPKAHLG